MSNMRHCRFQNTLSDLQDCYDWLSNNESTDLSNEEQRAFRQMTQLCTEIAEDFDYVREQ